MKIGFSFGRCIRDIVHGKVNIDDVVLVVARTRMENEEAIRQVVDGYYFDGVFGDADRDECLRLAMTLNSTGRLHQPRLFGKAVTAVANDFVWMDLVPSALTDNPAIESAWNTYRVALTLGGDVIPKIENFR